MAKFSFILHQFYALSVLALSLSSYCSAADDERQVYIVYMGALPAHGKSSPSSHHLTTLQEVVSNSSMENVQYVLVRSYKRSFNGFAAKLTEAEKEKLAGMAGVVSVFPKINYQPQTTRSWDFMGMPTTVKCNLTVESNIIIGVIDTGIWPESESFNDEGFGPPPKKWKGACKGGLNFTCNNKLIGARYYTNEAIDTARDERGHGTHTASTAAGREVDGVSFFGLAKGTARGGIPTVRIAAYKVCTLDGCSNEAILAAFDDAIADGVDIISISLGSSNAVSFERDSIAVGAFHAMERGILTVNSAGNSGPETETVASVAPWMLSVAASSTDSHFTTEVTLGNGIALVGQSVNSFDLGGKNYPLVHGRSASSSFCGHDPIESDNCACLDAQRVKGKIVLCSLEDGMLRAGNAGAIGVIVTNPISPDVPSTVPLPVSSLSIEDYRKVLSYMNSTAKPMGSIMKSVTVKDPKAPQIVSFSARGPNAIAADILKPDITAPGLNILAAYSEVAPPSELDTRRVKYNVLSGTSMACPHVSGIAGYLKTIHPDWSPSAIQSALMTSAWPMNSTQGLEGEFAYGSGHVNPLQATDPGLVYEAFKTDYINMLCGLNFTESIIIAISGDNKVKCPKGLGISAVRNLNYPSLTAQVLPAKPFNVTFTRTVTNVGSRDSTYKAKVIPGDSNVKIKVVPEILHFEALNEKKSFTVTVTGKELSGRLSSSLVWSDVKHSVRSPIVLYSVDQNGQI